MFRSIVISIVICITAVGCGKAQPRARGTGRAGNAAGTNAVPAVVDVSAQTVKDMITDTTNLVTMLHVWATWCPPCVAEFPEVVKLEKTYGTNGLGIVFLSADPESNRAAIADFLAKHGVTRKTYRAENINGDFIASISSDWRGAIPATFLYDKEGELKEWWAGARPYEDHEKAVKKILD